MKKEEEIQYLKEEIQHLEKKAKTAPIWAAVAGNVIGAVAAAMIIAAHHSVLDTQYGMICAGIICSLSGAVLSAAAAYLSLYEIDKQIIISKKRKKLLEREE